MAAQNCRALEGRGLQPQFRTYPDVGVSRRGSGRLWADAALRKPAYRRPVAGGSAVGICLFCVGLVFLLDAPLAPQVSAAMGRARGAPPGRAFQPVAGRAQLL